MYKKVHAVFTVYTYSPGEARGIYCMYTSLCIGDRLFIQGVNIQMFIENSHHPISRLALHDQLPLSATAYSGSAEND
jgi:hypothetical protein